MLGFNPLYAACLLAAGGLSPTFSADFTTGVMRPDLTFARASNATMFDSTGRLVWAPANLAIWSNTFTNVAWTKTLMTVISTTAIAPDGSATASTIQSAGGATIQQAYTGSVGLPATGAMWIRRRTGTGQVIFRVGNLINGQDITAALSSGVWQKFVLSDVLTSTVMRLGVVVQVSGDEVDIWQGQLELTGADSPKPYVATSASAYYSPRFDYEPVSLTPRGLLIEEQRTNIVPYSRDFAQAAWSKTDITVTAGLSIWGDGNGTLVTEGSALTAICHTGFTITANTTLNGSFVVKSAGASPVTWIRLLLAESTGASGTYAWFNVANGTLGGTTLVGTGSAATSKIINLGNGFYRVCVSCIVDAASTVGRLYINSATTNLSGVRVANSTYYLDNAQAEHLVGVTSIIPTYSVSAVRAGESAVLSGFTGYNATEGVLFASFETDLGSGFPPAFAISDGTANNRMHISTNFPTSSTIQGIMHSVAGGVNDVNSGIPLAVSGNARVAFRYKLNDYAGCTNGGPMTTDVAATPPVGCNAIHIGSGGVAGLITLQRWIKSVKYFDIGLTNAQLQALTA